MTLRRRGAVAVALVVAATVPAGCSALPGPADLGSGVPGSSLTCVGIPVGTQVLLGDVIGSPPEADITIVDVTLDDPHGVRLVDAMLIPIYPDTGIYGIGSASVPPDPEPPGWDERVEAAGAVVAAGDLGGIVVQVERTSDDAGFSAIRVAYEYQNVRYEKSATTNYELKDSCLVD